MKTKSIWGAPPKRIYNILKFVEDQNPHFTTCIVGCSDGKFLMPFARAHHEVTGYDIDEIALFGGKKDFPIVQNKLRYEYNQNFVSKVYPLEKKEVLGLQKRAEIEGVKQYTHLELRNFYRYPPNKKFDLVFTSCSLHYSVNKNFSLEEKINCLKSIVKVNGYLYIDYMMAINEEDDVLYNREKFFRKGEVKRYFDDDWEIIHLKENNNPTFEGAHVDCVYDHFHKFGYLLARRLR